MPTLTVNGFVLQRVNSRTQAKWRIPEDERVFDLNELDEWEERILWGDAPPNTYVAPRCVEGPPLRKQIQLTEPRLCKPSTA